uniref:HTH_48 domain-containing protein n=1 Tax=Strongyloides stercoralis TaxID=6248 RepID=A0AAF5D0J7_STRER
MSKRQFRQIYFYEFKLNRSAAQTARNINEVWGQGSVSECTVQRWFQKFRRGEFDLDDEEGRGRPPAIDDDELNALVEKNARTTVRELAEKLNVSISKLDKWIPYELNENQRNIRFQVSSTLILRNNNDPFLDRIVTCDEKWIFFDNRQQLAQSFDHDEVLQHFSKSKLNQKKVMLIVWWSAVGLIHYSFLNPGETITATKYAEQIDEIHQKIQRLRPTLINRKGPILLHDNTRPHVAQPALQKLNELGYETLPHPPHSPDLLPTDYHFFKHLNDFLNEKYFKNQAEIETAFNDFIASRTPEFYATGINKLVSRWQKCIDSSGFYFD